MLAAILLTVSTAAFCQFGLFYWRAMICGIASQPISERIRTAVGITAPAFSARDFRSVLSVQDLVPDLRGSSASFPAVRAYYAVIETLGNLVPAMSNWANAEMTLCTRYAAVLVDQHLERNMVCAAQMRGM
jgi:hypothetical protein